MPSSSHLRRRDSGCCPVAGGQGEQPGCASIFASSSSEFKEQNCIQAPSLTVLSCQTPPPYPLTPTPTPKETEGKLGFKAHCGQTLWPEHCLSYKMLSRPAGGRRQSRSARPRPRFGWVGPHKCAQAKMRAGGTQTQRQGPSSLLQAQGFPFLLGGTPSQPGPGLPLPRGTAMFAAGQHSARAASPGACLWRRDPRRL